MNMPTCMHVCFLMLVHVPLEGGEHMGSVCAPVYVCAVLECVCVILLVCVVVSVPVPVCVVSFGGVHGLVLLDVCACLYTCGLHM